MGIDLQVGRHPALDRAVRDARMRLIVERPGMAATCRDCDVAPPRRLAIRPEFETTPAPRRSCA